MSESRGKDDQSDIVTVPPPPGGDAYNAKTVVAPAPEEVLELLRAAQERAGIPPVPRAGAPDAGNDEASKPIVAEPVVITGGENLQVVAAPRPPAVDPTPAPIAPSPPGPEAPVAPLPARVDPMPPPIHAAESPPQRELAGAALVIIAVFVIGVALMLGIVWAIVRQR